MSPATARIAQPDEENTERSQLHPAEPAGSVSSIHALRALLPPAMRSQVRTAREMERARQENESGEVLPTTVPALDRLLAGGLPKGQLVELIGPRSSGRFSASLTALAAATSVGEAAALVDLGDGLDPSAALRLGVDLDRLLWLRPTSLKKALASAEMVLGAGFPLVVVDLGAPPLRGGRGQEAAWLRLARAAQAQGSALLVVSPYRVSGTAAAVVLKAARIRAAWRGGHGAPWLLAGTASQLEVEKQRGGLQGQTDTFDLAAPGSPKPAAAPPAPAKTRSEPRTVPAIPQEAPPLRAAAGRR